ncbi:MAG: hypothetical protein ABWZ16_07220 [Microbacterium sp.]
MQQPTYLRRLLNQKVLLIIGFVVALVAGLIAGFTITDGQVEPRATRAFMASSTVLLTAPQNDLFQTEIPGTAQVIPEGTDPATVQEVSAPIPVDLTNSAILLAYLASSDDIVDATAAAVGGFEDGDGVTAVRRTTQPGGDESFGGRLQLPIIAIVGTSTSAARAELIAAEATNAFSDLIVAQQDEWGIAEDIRLTLDELNAPVAGEPEGGNPAIPVIVVTVGIFLLFIALALIIEAARDRRRRKTEGEDDDADDTGAAVLGEDAAEGSADTDELVFSDADTPRRRGSRRRSAPVQDESVDEGELVPHGAQSHRP